MQNLYVDDLGKGYPLVLVHGYLGSSEMWNLQKNYLAYLNMAEAFEEPGKVRRAIKLTV